ncbi:DUF732 domain-containing protein [Williamsia sp. CHRR-6]|uniref:DUF732 domain-containing protein n=1 Tax=Williamsia sp. CHRR-6 TaxID=2835871 RepID=UPI001BDAD018|nr:DUF732 domain-containing protein [Williamsia sp. CHRR-6]MBT0567580.1 DUF732 domain-containing protein [Williamsia sp. CHRR-6]
MSRHRIAIATTVLGLALLAGATTACGSSDSTASSSDSSTTTTATTATAGPSTSGATSAAPTGSAPATPQAPADQGDAGSGLPATAPNAKTTAPSNFPGGAKPPAPGSKGEAFLAALKRAGVTIANDPDNSIALGAANIVCGTGGQAPDPAQVKTIVTAIVGSGTTDTAAAAATADKVIAAANATYCK